MRNRKIKFEFESFCFVSFIGDMISSNGTCAHNDIGQHFWSNIVKPKVPAGPIGTGVYRMGS